MKLLKILALSAITLAVSTQVMARGDSSQLYATSHSLNGVLGAMPTSDTLVIAKGMVVLLNTTQETSLLTSDFFQLGHLTNVLEEASSILYKSGNGNLNTLLWMKQTGFAEDEDNSLLKCAQISTPDATYHLTTKVELQAIVAALPRLKKAFNVARKQSVSFMHRPEAAEAVAVERWIADFQTAISDGQALLTSNQASATEAVTVNSKGAVGAVAKNLPTKFLCVSEYSPRMLNTVRPFG